MDDAHESGLCICAPGLSSCGGLCFDFAHDSQNCGGCGVACADGVSCDHGVCASEIDFAAQFNAPITVSAHPADVCTNADEAAVTTSANAIFSPTSVFMSHGTFPIITADSEDDMGEYITTSRRGVPGGVYATWAQPIEVSSDCTPCSVDNITTHSFAQVVKGASVFIPSP